MDNENDQNQAGYGERFMGFPQHTPPSPMSQNFALNPPPPVPPPKHSSGAMVGLVLSMAIVIAGMIFVSSLLKDAMNRAEQYVVSGVETYDMKDRPRYGEMVDLVNRLYDKYTRQDLTGEIWERFDENTEDYNYVIDYLSELNYYHKNLAIYAEQQSSSPKELDYEIDVIISDLNKLETRFIAKAPLTTTITITLENGTQVAVAKKTKTSLRYGGDTVSAAPDTPLLADAPLDKEAWARSFEGTADSNGTYRTAAGQLAERFDMYLDYNWANILDKCIGSSQNETEVIAAYCHATPDVVYVNKNATNYENNIRNIMFISTIKHEISHHIIATICGTARPPIAGAYTEGVTNSYANIYLGAHEKNEYYADHSEYQMSAETEAIARAIHDEKRCSV